MHTADKTTRAILTDAAARVESMMTLYDRLFQADDLQNLSIREYIPVLVEGIAAINPNQSKVKIDVDVEDIVLVVKMLTTLGIILSELINNWAE